MSRRPVDRLTSDLFLVPQPAAPVPGSMDYRPVVSALVSEMLRTCGKDRHQVAADVSRLTGKDVSKNMLDGYTAESREQFNLPLYLGPALEVACCGSTDLCAWFATVRGARLAIGADALHAELGRLERARDQAGERIRALKEQLRRSPNG